MAAFEGLDLERVLDDIEAGKDKRLPDLRQLLNANSRNPKLVVIKDKSIHYIFEKLFRFATHERAAWVKAQRPTTKEIARKKLILCAETLRYTVEFFLPQMRTKSINAVLGHVIQTLPTAEGNFCTPLTHDYFKLLERIFAHQPHVEHLSHVKWTDAVEFLFQSYDLFDEGDEAQSSNQHDATSFSRSMTSRSQGASVGSSDERKDVVSCVRSLISSQNSPLHEIAPKVLKLMCKVLENRRVRPAHHVAIEAINICLRRLFHKSSFMNNAIVLLLPILRRLWIKSKGSKSQQNELRGGLLAALLYLRPHVNAANGKPLGTQIASHVDGLYEALYDEYLGKQPREHLGLQDLFLDADLRATESVMPMQFASMALREGSKDAELTWTTLSIIGFLMDWIQTHSLAHKESSEHEAFHRSPKRVKQSSKLDDLYRDLSSKNTPERQKGALQVLCFFSCTRRLTLVEADTVVNVCQGLMSGQDADVVDWATMTVTCCTFKAVGTSISRQQWLDIWHLCLRNITSPIVCRASCHLANSVLSQQCVDYEDVKDSLDAFIASSINSPATVSETSLRLWLTVIAKRSLHMPGQMTASGYEQLVNWLSTKWDPSSFESKVHAQRMVTEAPPQVISHALNTIIGGTLHHKRGSPFPNLGALGQAWLWCIEHRKLSDWLLQVEDTYPVQGHLVAVAETSQAAALSKHRTRHELADPIFSFLTAQLEKSIQRWTEASADRAAFVNSDMIIIAFGLCLVALSFVGSSGTGRGRRGEILERKATDLSQQILGFALRRESLAGSDALLLSLAPFLPTLEDASSREKLLANLDPLAAVLRQISEAFRDRGLAPEDSIRKDRFDNEDDDFGPVGHVTSQGPPASANPRNQLSRFDTTSFIGSTVLYTHLALDLLQQARDSDTIHLVDRKFIDRLQDLPVTQLLATRPLLDKLTLSRYSIEPEAAGELLRLLGGSMLEEYDWNCCGIAIALLIETMIGTVTLWTDANLTDIYQDGVDLYKFLINVALKSGRCSTGCAILMADLLYTLLRVAPTYADAIDAVGESVRTSLFKLLKDSDTVAQHHIAERLPKVFETFTLSQHDRIYDDIVEVLPSEAVPIEDIYSRLVALTQIGVAWNNLLRRCVYNIFETIGNIPEAGGNAKTCIDVITNQLGLKGSEDLLKLFSSQILYTWLEDRPLEQVPFEIFNFKDLSHFAHQVEDDIVSFSLIKRSGTTLEDLSHVFHQTPKDLVASSFAKAAAVCFAQDVTSQNLKGGAMTHEAETRVRVATGDDYYKQLLKRHFQKIISIFFLHVENEDTVEKTLTKKKEYTQACSVMQKINKLGESDVTLSQGQQPSWRPKQFFEQLERVCRRVQRSHPEVWTPNLVVIVARDLLNNMHVAFGPLHACRVIQRIKILICLAGNTALTGYPLEVLLHGLRRFVTEKRSADVALPIFQYLIDSGTPHLVQSPMVTASTCVSVLLSMRGLLESTQDSTTQESAHYAMLSKASEFRDWLWEWIMMVQNHMDDQRVPGLADLLNAARRSTGRCSGLQGTPESDLLLLLLSGIAGQNPILDPSSSQLCLGVLCKDFLPPPMIHEDVLGAEVDAAAYATAIWKSLRATELSSNYLDWAARALGQSYRCTGQVEADITLESSLNCLHRGIDQTRKGGDALKTKQRIMTVLSEQLRSEDSAITGLAEAAIKTIISRYENTEESAAILLAIPRSVAENFAAKDRLSPPELVAHTSEPKDIYNALCPHDTVALPLWTRQVVLRCLDSAQDEPILTTLRPLVEAHDALPGNLLAYVLHLTLGLHVDRSPVVGDAISEGVNDCFSRSDSSNVPQTKMLLDAWLYLRSQRIPKEKTAFDRNGWLSIDLQHAARAAQTCGMAKTALLIVEIFQNTTKTDDYRRASRRSSVMRKNEDDLPSRLLGPIVKTIDEPDAFYGVEHSADLDTIADRLEYEGDGIQSLLFRGAQIDSMQKSANKHNVNISNHLLGSLTKLSLSTLVAHFAEVESGDTSETKPSGRLARAAIKLGQWDLPTPASVTSMDDIMYRFLQSFSNLEQSASPRRIVANGTANVFQLMKTSDWALAQVNPAFQTFASLSSIGSLIYTPNGEFFMERLDDLLQPRQWMESTRPDSLGPLLVAQEALAGIITKNDHLRNLIGLDSRQALLAEAKTNLAASKTYRKLDMMQESLSTVTYLSRLSGIAKSSRLSIAAAVQQETANVLWDRGEFSESIRTLQGLSSAAPFDGQDIPVGQAGLLADLAHHVSYARLEKPDDILSRYLRPALKELTSSTPSSEIGKVYHEYAAYCHNQLDSPDAAEDLRRLERNRRQRTADMKELRSAATQHSKSKERSVAEKELASHQKWQDIDKVELERLTTLRQQFLTSSLENYLRSLAASDDHDTDVIRFLAIWLAHADDPSSTGPVSKHAPKVPSKKFISLMNQLSSRLQNSDDDFQQILGDLVVRICHDHPYHGMYHVFAGSKSSRGHDSQAQSRQGAASRIAKQLERSKGTSETWLKIAKSNELYNRMARLKAQQIKQHAKLQMKDFDEAKKVYSEVPKVKVPPITMGIDIRDDMNYDSVPWVQYFYGEFSVPGGISAPKVVLCKATNGKRYKQLFKGGSDDLRQDAIMEQVFEQVSALLKLNKATRQRGLRIRTYKVVPLDAQGGAIEFVEPTMSIGEYLEPAHVRYHPKDLKWPVARHKMNEVGDLPKEQKTIAFKDVCSKFNPVLRHFFFERFEDPDDWFDKRLAYTRSTAAISILGHVLGLGDRHCHNILLDTNSGEVVHIDLGVAFEAGRVLPKPELVPFRLTRDIVDGFGILGTEGVFRRCCEFTLEALRQNKDTIITLLNVLRYDPLYSWSVSPLRAKRLQNEQESRALEQQQQQQQSTGGAVAKSTRRSRGGADEDGDGDRPREKKREDQGGEADRALSTVERKLAAGLSVSATVNELIQQATDERNLAQLFHGWSAFA